ncbi:MAG: GreA/GreB family elongation factor, partial [Bdellovibrionota bacterium]
LSCNGTLAFYFVVPQGGGLITRVDGKAVQIITPLSPIGEALMGKRVGDLMDVETRSGDRQYKVISIR